MRIDSREDTAVGPQYRFEDGTTATLDEEEGALVITWTEQVTLRWDDLNDLSSPEQIAAQVHYDQGPSASHHDAAPYVLAVMGQEGR